MKQNRVDPELYTEKYYLTEATGYKEYKKTYGSELENRFVAITKLIPSVRNFRVLDVGCGRGELAIWAAKNGAKEVIGIDYAKAAIKLAKLAHKKQTSEIRKKIKFILRDAKSIKYKNKFDAIFLTEVVEHLYPPELQQLFTKLSKVVTREGYIFIHTAPSRIFNDYTYKLWCYPISSFLVGINNLFSKKTYPNIQKPQKLRNYYHKIMHVNEPSYFSLRSLFLESGFKGTIKSTNVTVNKPILSWKDKLFNFLVYLTPISNTFPFNVFWGNDFYAILRRK